MFRWLEELYEIRRRNREVALFCPTCEALKVELAAERREKEMLLHKLLNTTNEPQPESTGNPVPVVARHRPWRVIQQELETKDRAEADRILREFREKTGSPTQSIQPVPIPASRSESIANVERELGLDAK
jgi:hypothetical protein